MVVQRPSRGGARTRTCLAVVERGLETMRGEAVDSSVTRVRRATVNDVGVVVARRVACLGESAKHPVYGRLHPDVEARARPLFEQQIKAVDQAIFLAEREGEVVGSVRCADVKGSPLLITDRYCYITSVFVRPGHRRHGVLGTLMEQAEDWARTRGLTELRLHNSTLNQEARSAWDQL